MRSLVMTIRFLGAASSAFLLFSPVMPAAAPVFADTILAMAGGGTNWADFSEEQQIVEQAETTLRSIQDDQAFSVALRGMRKEVKAVFIAPRVRSDSPGHGAAGDGVLVVRDEQSASWFGPAFYTLASSTLIANGGGSLSDIVLVIITQKGLEAFTVSVVKLGEDVSFAPGNGHPAGSSDVIGYMRADGRFTGFAPRGTVVVPSDIRNALYYERAIKPAEIISKHESTRRSSSLRKTATSLLP